MNKVNFVGDMSKISEPQRNYIAKILDYHGFNESTVTIEQAGGAGDSTTANVKRVKAEKNGATFKLIVKIAPKDRELRDYTNVKEFFNNELVMYTEVFPKFMNIEKAAGIPASERVRYPIYYGSMTEEGDEMLLLEDLSDSNYVMLDKFKSFKDENIKLVLSTFARFHSLSYALKHQSPEIFNYFDNKLVNPREKFDLFADYFCSIEKDTIDLFDGDDDKFKEAIKDTLSKLKEMMVEFREADKGSSFTVIEQGDAWTNNFLFLMQDGKTTSCCMLDYQLSRVNSPAADLHYMLFNCTDHQTRTQCFTGWLDYYHAELAKSLSAYGLKVDLIYPRQQLDQDMKKYAKLYLALGILIATNLSRCSEEIAELKSSFETQGATEVLKTNGVLGMRDSVLALYKLRVKGLIDSFFEFGYL